jgi:hypothetical protein
MTGVVPVVTLVGTGSDFDGTGSGFGGTSRGFGNTGSDFFQRLPWTAS